MCLLLMQSAVRISTVHCVEQAEATEENLDRPPPARNGIVMEGQTEARRVNCNREITMKLPNTPGMCP